MFEVVDTSGQMDAPTLISKTRRAFELLTKVVHEADERHQGALELHRVIQDIVRSATLPSKALKHITQKSEKALGRFQDEIRLLQSHSHDALIPIIDSNISERWFVTELYSSTLSEHLSEFRGNGLRVLQSIRPIVQAVTNLHSSGVVHRDIKPDNIFSGTTIPLVLGDFGIAIDLNDDETRLTATFERVGSRDWMPPWAALGRLEDVSAVFDTYTIGKVIWAMLLGTHRLPHRYGVNGDFDITADVCPADEVPLLEGIVRRSVVEKASEGLQTSGELLGLVDDATAALTHGYQDVKQELRRCLVCGKGRYVNPINLNAERQEKFGLTVVDEPKFKIFVCIHCGHAQLFYFMDGLTPDAWVE